MVNTTPVLSSAKLIAHLGGRGGRKKALIDAGLGNYESAMTQLELAHREKDVMLRDLLVDPPWDPMRSEKRFEELMGKMFRTPWPSVPCS